MIFLPTLFLSFVGSGDDYMIVVGGIDKRNWRLMWEGAISVISYVRPVSVQKLMAC